MSDEIDDDVQVDEPELATAGEDDGSAAEGDAPADARELTDEEQAQIAELDEAIAKFEGQKRWSDMIKSIVAKAEILPDPSSKIELLSEAGRLYVEKSSNQAEAIKCFEKVLEVDEYNLEAIEQLKAMYERRRDWESLVRIRQRAARLMEPGDRVYEAVEIAQLATQRLRKPDICIDLWQDVLQADPENPEALGELAKLYERAREWQPLAEVLDKQVEYISEEKELKQALSKLGMIYADKLSDDEGAVRAFRRLLALDPTDRRAQEQLKKRFIALKSWDELEDFYASTEKWTELIRTLEREAEGQNTDPEERSALLFRAARIWEEKEGKPERAARAYEKILAKDDSNLEAAIALSPIYESAGDARKLAGVYEIRLAHLDDPQERIHLLRETALLYEERLRKPQDAFDRFLQAFQLEPTLDVLQEDVRRLAEATRGWDQAVDAYQRAIDDAMNAEVEVELRLRAAELLVQVERTEDAIAQYRAVSELAPDDRTALDALDALYRQASKWAELLQVLERRAELETDPSVRRELAYGRARLQERELGDRPAAIDSYQAILDEYGDGEEEAFGALDRLYEAEARWPDLAATLERRIDLGPASTEELAGLKFRLAQVLAGHLHEKDRALETYREVLVLVPEHAEARAALEAFLEDEALGANAATILEPIYEMQGAWEPLVTALEVLVRHAEGEPDRQLELLAKIGEVTGGEIGDAGRCFDAYARGLRAVPESDETLGRLEGLAVEQERFADLTALVEELAGEVGDPSLSRYLWTRAALYHDGQLNQVDEAVAAYRQVLEQDPGDAEVLDALDELYRRTERWRDLLGVLRRKAELADTAEAQEELLAQVAEIHEEMLGEPEQSVRVYTEILELDPGSTRALGALDRLFEQQERWSELADNIGRQLVIAETEEEQTALQLRLADLQEARMGRVEVAIEIHREVLERDAGNPQALGALERLVQTPEHQAHIAGILEPLYRDAQAFEKLVGIHEIQARHAESPMMRSELLHRIAELHEAALDDLPSAFDAFARALAEDPADLHSQEQLERVARASGAFEGLAQVYEERVQGVEDPTLAASLHVKAAVLREEELGDNEAAIAHYTRVLELDPQHLEAATALERLYQVVGRYEELARILLSKADMIDAVDDQKDHLFRAAAIYEEILQRPQDAIGVYRKILDVDLEELGALDKLIELFLHLEQWPDLLAVYNQKADVVYDPEEKKRLYLEVGAVYERELRDIDKAIDTYQRILEIDPDDLVAIGRLDALYQSSGNWEELLNILEREADLAGHPNEVLSYRYRIADLWDNRLGDPMRAVEGYREILTVAPDHAPTLDALEKMIDAGKEPREASLVLEPIYLQTGESDKLVRVLEVQVEHEEGIQRVELLHRVAELQEVHLGQLRPAFDAYARAVPADSGNPHTLEQLERLAHELDLWGEVTRLYDTEVEKLQQDAPDLLVDMALRVARIYAERVGDVENAIRRYQTVLEVDDLHHPAIEALDGLYAHTQRWPELAEILQREIELAATPDDVLGFQLRLGQVFEHRLDRVDDAIQQYRDILAAEPTHEGALAALEGLFAAGVQQATIAEILEPLYRMSESWSRLLGVLEVQVALEEDADERVSRMHRIAEIAEDRAMAPDVAFGWMQRALLEQPMHDHSIGEVERLAEGLDGWGQLADTYATVLAPGGEGGGAQAEVQVEGGKRLARIYLEELLDVDRAVESYLFVLGADGQERETLEALDRLYTEHGAHDALAQVLRRRVEAADDDYERVDLSYRLGQVLENDLGRIDEAIAVYDGILANLDAEHADSIAALENIYIEKQDWPALFGTFEKEIEVALGDTGRAEVTAKMARVASLHLGDHDRAIDLWKDVLELRGEDPEALNALGQLYAQLERWPDLVEILDREAMVADDDETRVRILADRARVFYRQLGNRRDAIDGWHRVFDVDPVNPEALFALAELYREGEQWTELAEILTRLREAGEQVLEPHLLETSLMQLADLYENTLDDRFGAVEVLDQVLLLFPENFVAMDALERIHRQDEEWRKCIAVMEHRVAQQTEGADKIEGLLAIGAMYADPVEAADEGTSAYQRVLALDPLHQVAFEKVEALHEAAGRSEDLVELYLNRIDISEKQGEIVDLYRRVAKVQEEGLNDLHQALAALLLAWQTDFTDATTADVLERVAGLAGNWNEPLELANDTLEQLRGDDDPDTREIRIAICLRCAKWYGKELGHPDYAVPYYNEILSLDPTNFAAMQSQADLFRTLGDWQSLAQTLGRMTEIVQKSSQRAEVYNQMGELCENELAIPDQAPGYYQQALDADPAHLGAIGNMERRYRNARSWSRLLEILQLKVDALTEQEDITEARLQVAEAQVLHLGQIDAGIETYQVIRQEAPEEIRALKGLEQLYAQRENWQELFDTLEAQLELVTAERDQITLLTRLAGMLEEVFVKPERAAERLERVLEIDYAHMGALRGLERLYRHMQRWDDLIATLERHVNATAEKAEHIEAYSAMGDVYARQIGEPEKAIDAYQNLLDVDPEHVPALDALARLYEGGQEYGMALDAMGRLSALLKDPAQVVDLRYRMGHILDGELGDRTGAVESYKSALDVDPGHLPSLEAVRKIHLDDGEWVDAARVLQQEIENQPADRPKAILLVELGRLFDERLDEREQGIAAFEQAYAADPDNEDAALPLAEEYHGAGRWQEAFPILDMLVKRSNKRPEDEQHRFAYLLGETALELGDTEAAVKALSKAFAVDSGDLPTLLKLAEAYFKAEDWPEAFKYYQMLLMQQRDSLAPDELTDVFYKLGVIKRAQGDRRKAINMFDKALEEDGYHRPTLEAMVSIHEEQEEWERAVYYRREVLNIADVEERFGLLEELGDLLDEKADNPAEAIDALQEAASMDPGSHTTLHKLLMLFQKTGRWGEAVETIDQIAALDERDGVKAKYRYTTAVILRDEVEDIEGALERFGESLDLDPTHLKGFEAINKILTEKKDWKQLERAFRKMIRRIADREDEFGDLPYNLWHNLGVIYRDRLKHYESAVQAFTVASQKRPESTKDHQILAELYTMLGGDKLENAIQEHQWLLRQDPYRVESYQALYRLYFDARAYDKAWCLAATLTFLKKADQEQQQFYLDNKPSGPIRPQSRLDNERWFKDLAHPTQDLILSRIFEQLWPSILSLRIVTDKQAGLHAKDQVDLATTTVSFARTFKFVSDVLGIPTPRLFLRTDVQGGLTHRPVFPLASLCGGTLLSGFSPPDLMFVSGRHLSDYRPEHYIRSMLNTNTELKTVLLAALRIAEVIPSSDPAVDETARQILTKMQPANRDALRTLGRRFVDAGAKTNIKRWLQAVELTSCRAGFLVCNDLETAARMVTQLPAAGPVDLPPKEKVKELVLFSVSEEYFTLRERLGIRIALAG
jgi:tetratricopeptide (TPR) repeat protein